METSETREISQMKFSVLMSIYKKECPEWFITAVESVESQTVKPDEVVIVQDGPLTDPLYDACDKLKNKYSNIRYIKLKQNQGLGIALQYGVKACKNELIARMDTDDISVPDRFEKQLKEFSINSSLSLCGGFIEEFSTTPEELETTRKVPLTKNEIISFGKKRNPFNHMTVMFRKADVLAAGNYQSFLLFEDYYLWVRMIMKDYEMKNIADTLVLVRTGKGMIARRGGIEYFKKEKKLYQEFYRLGYINKAEMTVLLALRMIVHISPNWVRRIVYKNILRK